MKRMTFICSMLLALLFTAAGVGPAIAQMETPPEQDVKSDFDVTFQGNVVGTLTIDGKHQTYAFEGKGLTPGTTYYLVCNELKRSLGSAEASKTGTVRMKDTWDQSFWEGLNPMEPPTFVLSITPTGEGRGCVVPCEFRYTCYAYAPFGTQMGGHLYVGGRTCEGRTIDIYTRATDAYAHTFSVINEPLSNGCPFSVGLMWWYHPPTIRYSGDGIVCPCSIDPPWTLLCLP